MSIARHHYTELADEAILKKENEAKEQQNKIANNLRFSNITGTVDAINITAIFSMFAHPTLRNFLTSTGHFFLFPIAAALNMVQGILMMRQAYLEGGKKHAVVRAGVELFTSTLVLAAVGLGFIGIAGVATLAPIIFTGVMGIRALFSAAAAFFYWGKYTVTQDPNKKQEYSERAKSNVVGAISGTLATIAIATIMVFGHGLLINVGLGVAAGVLATGYGIYKLVKSSAKKTDQKQPVTPDHQSDYRERADESISSTAKLTNQLGHNPAPSNQAPSSSSPNWGQKSAKGKAAQPAVMAIVSDPVDQTQPSTKLTRRK